MPYFNQANPWLKLANIKSYYIESLGNARHEEIIVPKVPLQACGVICWRLVGFKTQAQGLTAILR